MSIYKIILPIFFMAMMSCASDTATTSNSGTSPAPTPSTSVSTPAATPPATTGEPAQNADGVWHYTCSNGCAGGAGSATACAGCGSTLVHNQGYHASAGTTTPPPPNLTTSPASNTGAPFASPQAEPAQNAAGVWHYTCSSGCAGGGGSAIACAGCGGTLVHNAAYHQ